jgi:hypothetical protein
MDDSVDGCLAVFGEVFEAFHGFKPKAADDRQRGIAQSGQHLWDMAHICPSLILAACDIANVT